MTDMEITSITDLHSALERIQELKGYEPGTLEALERHELVKAIEKFDANNLAYEATGDRS